MAITINGSGSITGLVSGGLPDGSVTAADLASSLDLSGKTITNMNPSGVYLGGTGSANYLDDYETGTWTPSLTFGGGTTGLTYTRQAGKYVKVGNIVHVMGHLQIDNKGTSTGIIRVTGFPFTISNATYGQFTPLGDRGKFNTGGEIVSLYLSGGTTTTMYSSGFDGGANAVVQDTAVVSTTEIDFNFSYITD